MKESEKLINCHCIIFLCFFRAKCARFVRKVYVGSLSSLFSLLTLKAVIILRGACERRNKFSSMLFCFLFSFKPPSYFLFYDAHLGNYLSFVIMIYCTHAFDLIFVRKSRCHFEFSFLSLSRMESSWKTLPGYRSLRLFSKVGKIFPALLTGLQSLLN